MGKLMACGDGLHQFIAGGGREGSWCRLSCYTASAEQLHLHKEVYFLVAHVRLIRPAMSVLAMADASPAGVLTLRTAGGKFVCQTVWSISVEFFAAMGIAVAEVKACELDVANVPGSWMAVTMKRSIAEKTVYMVDGLLDPPAEEAQPPPPPDAEAAEDSHPILQGFASLGSLLKQRAQTRAPQHPQASTWVLNPATFRYDVDMDVEDFAVSSGSDHEAAVFAWVGQKPAKRAPAAPTSASAGSRKAGAPSVAATPASFEATVAPSQAASSSSGPASAAPAVQIPPAQLAPDPNHKPWWLTRTNRKASCAACNAAIPKCTFRLLAEPDPGTVLDKKRWRKVWWSYYHVAAACIVHAGPSTPLRDISELQRDVAPMPKAHAETPEQYEAAIDQHVALALQEFGKAGMYGPAPAILQEPGARQPPARVKKPRPILVLHPPASILVACQLALARRFEEE